MGQIERVALIYTLPCVKQITSENLLYTTGSSGLCDDLEGRIEGAVGERPKKEGYMYIYS